MLQVFACGLARIAFLQNITLLAINKKATLWASFIKSCEKANQHNNSGETEEVTIFWGLEEKEKIAVQGKAYKVRQLTLFLSKSTK